MLGRKVSRLPSTASIHQIKLVLGGVFIVVCIINAVLTYLIHSASSKKHEKLLSTQDILQQKQRDLNDIKATLDQWESISKQIKQIPKEKLTMIGVNVEALNLVMKRFISRNNSNLIYSSKETECQIKDQIQDAKCHFISVKIEKISSDGVYKSFDNYIRHSMPGFVFPTKISIKKNENLGYDAEGEYVWIYFNY